MIILHILIIYLMFGLCYLYAIDFDKFLKLFTKDRTESLLIVIFWLIILIKKIKNEK